MNLYVYDSLYVFVRMDRCMCMDMGLNMGMYICICECVCVLTRMHCCVVLHRIIARISNFLFLAHIRDAGKFFRTQFLQYGSARNKGDVLRGLLGEDWGGDESSQAFIDSLTVSPPHD
ncbi:hypothetical protein EON65_35330 [archaeon]|nr:MAG: hypothetical protein EON65_35330 [archaeon]